VRVLIADDSAFMRRMLTKLFEDSRNIEVVGTARNGADAVAKCAELEPDVVTMDVEMPEMDGLEALRQIRKAHGPVRPAVLMCSTLTEAGSETALEALRLGAADVICKESLGHSDASEAFRSDLLMKVRAVGIRSRASLHPPLERRPAADGSASRSPRPSFLPRQGGIVSPGSVSLLAIGSSTGGPPVLESILSSLPGAPCKPILIAQHMPEVFTKSLASRLDQVSPARVVLARDGDHAEPGTVYIAEGGKHLRVRGSVKRMVLEVSPEPGDALYKPSVNELFASAARVLGARAFGVVLTGMGDDGLLGARELTGAGAKLIAQDEASCVVYGMPRAVTEAGVSAASLTPELIAHQIGLIAGCAGGAPGLRESA
jgi:two-component system chemotaxis response regulator CheB